MNSKWTRLLARLVVACMMLSVFCACADDTTEEEQNPDDQGQQGNTDKPDDEEEEDIVYTADIPAGYSGGGDTFTVYTFPEEVFVWKDFDWQHAGTLNSDRINDAVFSRSSQVAEELDIVVDWYCGVSFDDPAEFRTDITSGEGQFDIGNIVMLKHIDMVQQGLLAEINSYGELDLEAP